MYESSGTPIRRPTRSAGVAIPADRFWLTGIVIVITILLASRFHGERLTLRMLGGALIAVATHLALSSSAQTALRDVVDGITGDRR